MGRRGEDLACDYLQAQGFVIVDRNWRGGRGNHGELDIVAVKDGIWHFVEVRSRSAQAAAFLSPEESLTYGKQQSLLRSARAYIALHKAVEEVQIDLVAVVFGAEGPQLRYYPNAVYPQNHA